MPTVLNPTNIEYHFQRLQFLLQAINFVDDAGNSLVSNFSVETTWTEPQIAGIKTIIQEFDFDVTPIIEHNNQVVDRMDRYAGLDAFRKYYNPLDYIDFYKSHYPEGTPDAEIRQDLQLKANSLTPGELIKAAYELGMHEGGGQRGIQRQQAEHSAAQAFSDQLEERKAANSNLLTQATNFFGKQTSKPQIEPIEEWLSAILDYRSKLSLVTGTLEQLRKHNLNSADETVMTRAALDVCNFYEMLKLLIGSIQNETAYSHHFFERRISAPKYSYPNVELTKFSMIVSIELTLFKLELQMIKDLGKILNEVLQNSPLASFATLFSINLTVIEELNLSLIKNYRALQALKENNRLLPSAEQQQLNKIHSEAVPLRKKILSLMEQLFEHFVQNPDNAIQQNFVRWQKNFNQQHCAASNSLRLVMAEKENGEKIKFKIKDILDSYEDHLKIITTNIATGIQVSQINLADSPKATL